MAKKVGTVSAATEASKDAAVGTDSYFCFESPDDGHHYGVRLDSNQNWLEGTHVKFKYGQAGLSLISGSTFQQQYQDYLKLGSAKPTSIFKYDGDEMEFVGIATTREILKSHGNKAKFMHLRDGVNIWAIAQVDEYTHTIWHKPGCDSHIVYTKKHASSLDAGSYQVKKIDEKRNDKGYRTESSNAKFDCERSVFY